MKPALKSTLLLFSFLVASLFATSCATFPKNQLPKVSATPASGAKKVSLTYSLKSGHDLTGSRTEGTAQQNGIYEKALVSAMEKSGRFSSVKSGKGGAVHLDLDMLNHGNGGLAFVSGFISGFSLFTIPGGGSDNYTLTANARTSSGRSREYRLDDGVTTVFWLPLIFAAPFANPLQVMPQVQENMFANLVPALEKDGLIPRN